MTRNPQFRLGHSDVAMTNKPNVAVLTDDRALADALAQVDAFTWTDPASCDIALVDMPVAREHLTVQLPAVTSIALVDNSAAAQRAMEAGAAGALLRDQVLDGVIAAVQAVRHGLRVVDIALDAPRAATATPRVRLTERENQVVQLLAEGLSNKLIADRLGISDHTAKFHVNGVLTKLGASTRTEAVVRAMRDGIVAMRA